MAASIRASAPVVAPRQQAAGLARVAPKAVQPKAVTNAKAAKQMMVWQPMNNKFFETFSYLPPLSDGEISRQVQYITNNGWVPCLEFTDAQHSYVGSESCIRFGPVAANYADNRYWTMWKLPMFGCTDPNQVLLEISACQKAFPNAYIRMVAFDAVKQVQVAGFLVQRPASATDHQPVEGRSTA